MDSDYFSQSQNTAPSDIQQLAGTILKIHMKNFMCHDNLEVKLNPRVNFICGKNGSGKSAIQTAVAVGLGGKAFATNRGSSLKALIKNDRNSCSIVIVLSNKGPMAFMPSVYGIIIQVERNFSHTSQGYKIKNAFGKVVTTERKELDKIVSQFNIQTDNPICILHQDVARNFLNTSDPKMKFKFYMKAFRFEDIDNMYVDSRMRVHATREAISMKFAVVKEAFKDVIEMQQKLKIMEDAKLKEQECIELEHELVWANVYEMKVKMEDLEKRKNLEVLAKEKTERKIKETEERNLKERLKELEERIQNMNALVKEAKANLAHAREAYTKKREELSAKCELLKEAKRAKNRTKSKYESCLAEIENLTKNAPEMKLQQERLKKEIAECEEKLDYFKAAENSFAHDRQQLRDTAENLNEPLQSLTARHNDCMRQKSKREEQIKQLINNTSSLAMYGDVMMRIVDEISKMASQKKFEKKPIGPIGIHIKVKDSVWAGPVENFLGKSLLSSFCVDNSRDMAVLNTVLKTICGRYNSSVPSIMCSKFLPQVHNIRDSETGTALYRNLARMLDIDNAVVANCLIDQREIESVLLIPTNKEAYMTLDEQHKVPRNCRRAFTLTGDQFYPAPKYKSYSCNKSVTHATLLQVKQEEIIRELKTEIIKLNEDITAITGEKNNVQIQMTNISDSLKKNEIELKKIKKQRFTLEQQINELQNSVEPEAHTNVEYFVTESKVLKDQYEKEHENFESLKLECEQLNAETKETQNVYEALKDTIAKSDQEKAPIQGEIQQLKSTIDQTSVKVDLLKQKIRVHDEKLNKIMEDIAQLSEQLDNTTESATEICNPVETQRKAEDIQRELKNVETYLNKLREENGGTYVDVERNLNERQADFDAVNNDLNIILSIVQNLQSILKKRKIRESRIQLYVNSAVKHSFQMYVSAREFDGKLEFDSEAKTLKIKVKPQNDDDDNKKRLDATSLSGGEKSFSTVSLILALWSELELPFHFLDEFDVFMDEVNRSVVMDLLTAYATKTKRQFVFLTPLKMSSLDLSKYKDLITIHRLEAPRQ